MEESPKRHSRALLALVLVIGLAAGVGVSFLLFGGSDDSSAPIAADGTTDDGDGEALAELPEPDPLTDAAGATDPEAALRGYLAAEAADEWERSYEFLVDDLREVAFTTPAAWVSAHADFPDVVAYRIDDVSIDEEGGTAEITTLTGFAPTLNRVLGLVAARGRTTWSLEEDAEGLWRVNTNASDNQPLYPGSGGVQEAVQAWVDGRVACDDTTDLESGLIGTPVLADRLCEDDQDADAVTVGQPGPLTDSDEVSALLNAWGPEVFAWARVVEVDAATPLRAVVAPLGDEWRVVAVLRG